MLDLSNVNRDQLSSSKGFSRAENPSNAKRGLHIPLSTPATQAPTSIRDRHLLVPFAGHPNHVQQVALAHLVSTR